MLPSVTLVTLQGFLSWSNMDVTNHTRIKRRHCECMAKVSLCFIIFVPSWKNYSVKPYRLISLFIHRSINPINHFHTSFYLCN